MFLSFSIFYIPSKLWSDSFPVICVELMIVEN